MSRLSEREIQVLRLVAKGQSNKAIGKALWLSEYTVKAHVRRIMGKLNALDRAHAVGCGYENGLLGIESEVAA